MVAELVLLIELRSPCACYELRSNPVTLITGVAADRLPQEDTHVRPRILQSLGEAG